MFRAALNHQYNLRTIKVDEWRAVKPFNHVDASRPLLLTKEQVGRLLEVTTGGFHQIVKAGVLTGARYGELCSALVQDFDSKAGTLVLSGKTGERTVTLSDTATLFFKSVTASKLPKANLLTQDDGSQWSAGSQRTPWKRAHIAAKLPDDAVYYSLRHFHISMALKSGVQGQMIAEACGTSVLMIEKHYGKFDVEHRKSMANQIELGI